MNYLNHPIVLGVALVIGLLLLLMGADKLVDGASALAKRLHVNDLIIGLTIVAFGTSMPELVVNIVSVAQDATDLAITNILGSNIFNTLVIVGVSALIYPCSVQRSVMRIDLPLTILAGVMMLAMVLINGPKFDGVSRIEGGILLVVFAAFLAYNLLTIKKQTAPVVPSTLSTWMSLLWIVVGLLCLVAGGVLMVRTATAIAQRMGVAESIIGLTIVALGTSLPELATSAIAALKRNSDIAIGNVVGSNLFNVFFILGTSALIRPLPSYAGIATDGLLTALSAFVMWLLALCNRPRSISRWGGLLLLLMYAAYLAYRILL